MVGGFKSDERRGAGFGRGDGAGPPGLSRARGVAAAVAVVAIGDVVAVVVDAVGAVGLAGAEVEVEGAVPVAADQRAARLGALGLAEFAAEVVPVARLG